MMFLLPVFTTYDLDWRDMSVVEFFMSAISDMGHTIPLPEAFAV